jgi:excisionase family DNA binding protein
LDGRQRVKARNIKQNQKNAGGRDREDSERRTVSVEEAARMLGISRGAAYAYANTGRIPTIRLGKRLLVPSAALEKLLQGDRP